MYGLILLKTPHARRLARRVVDDFANEYVIELKRKEFKKMVSKIADNATKQEEVLKVYILISSARKTTRKDIKEIR